MWVLLPSATRGPDSIHRAGLKVPTWALSACNLRCRVEVYVAGSVADAADPVMTRVTGSSPYVGGSTPSPTGCGQVRTERAPECCPWRPTRLSDNRLFWTSLYPTQCHGNK